ncbi:hypothetical protein CDCA_CDCA18G4580 [Cyanidium caldarium]|uniref:Uncharacterized protein n=1 Tax=Cyanidium caldarium TaxID=2771 RepID=A0AAV9J2H2_CYACA|nr:hypothetical protein CDCA_CDCA18G4580 [Cyanidium caldarium]
MQSWLCTSERRGWCWFFTLLLMVMALTGGWCLAPAVAAPASSSISTDSTAVRSDGAASTTVWQRAAAQVRVTTPSGDLDENVADQLNYTQFEYTVVNALHHLNPKICLNEALSTGAANVVDLLTLCTVEEVASGGCTEVTGADIQSQLELAGWSGTDYKAAQIAMKLPASYFNWTDGAGLVGHEAYEAALKVVPGIESVLGATARDGHMYLAGAALVAERDDNIYAYVVLGSAPNQTCYGRAPGQYVYDYVGPYAGYITTL